MINYETLLSSYDNKLTLMKWLQKVEAALLNASLSSVSISQPTSDTAVLTFVFADGSTLASPTLSLPAGPQGPQGVQGPQGPQGVKGPKGDTGAQGPKGEDGTSVRILEDADACTQLGDGYIDANGDLQVLTSLSPKTFTNAGHIQGPQGPQGEQGIQGIQGPQGIQGEQGIQGPAGQNGTNGTNGADGVSITNVSVNASNHLIVTLSSGSTIDAGEIQVSGGMSNPMTTQGDIIVGGASGTPTRLAKGTAGQVLAMNSDATDLEWTSAGGGGGGGTQLYKHAILFYYNSWEDVIEINIISNTNTSSTTGAAILSLIKSAIAIYKENSYTRIDLLANDSGTLLSLNTYNNVTSFIEELSYWGGTLSINGNSIDAIYDTVTAI